MCSGVKIFGGDGKFGKWATIIKAFELPPHHAVRLKVQFWKYIYVIYSELIHGTRRNSLSILMIILFIDRSSITVRVNHCVEVTNITNVGGHSEWNELVLDMNLAFKHSAPTAVVGFSSTLDQAADDESWGIRDFQFFAYKCPEGCDACVQGETQE